MGRVYKNSTELMNLHGVPIYMNDMVDACLLGRLNIFLQGDTGSGKTQLAEDARALFKGTIGDGNFAKEIQNEYREKLGENTNLAIDKTNMFEQDKTLFVLGRNDMDTRELFFRLNLGKLNQDFSYNLEPLINPNTGEIEFYYPYVDEKGIFIQRKLTHEQAKVVRKGLEKLAGTTEDIKELTSKINTNLIVVDELPNCVPAVRAQLFNLFDGFIEVNGKPYKIGNGYSVGIATGNVGQKFTESTNELGRALKDRMHVIIDTDYFHPRPSDTLEILAGNTNPRVEFSCEAEDKSQEIILKHVSLTSTEIPFEKLLVANYLIHGLDYCSKGSKRKMGDGWPNKLENHEQGSEAGLILPVSIRGAKSIIRLSQALDKVAEEKGIAKEVIEKGYFDSMMQAFKFVSAYSGVLNEGAVRQHQNYQGDKYKAMDAIIATTNAQFEEQANNIARGLDMVKSGKSNKKVLDTFTGKWEFMKNTLEGIVNSDKSKE